MASLEELYRELTGVDPLEVKPLTPAGSSRRYFRLTGPKRVVGVLGTVRAENEAFIWLSRHLASKNLPVPRVLMVSDDRMAYLQTDLGDTSLFSCLSDTELVEKTLRALPAIQVRGAEGMDWSVCYPVAEFDSRAVMWDLSYFKYSYLNPLEIPYSEPLLEDAFRLLAAEAEKAARGDGGGLMLRDFQSRNVMVFGNSPWFIDFQGARRGPLAYDVASFLWQAKAGFSPAERERLVKVYADALAELRPLPADWDRQLDLMVILRTLQVLGAYGFRGLVQGKAHFIASIPGALANLRHILETSELLRLPAYAVLREVLERVAERPPVSPEAATPGRLTVRVSSFSFKKGIPLDPSGNGGGFVFDCRAMDNPGRYDEYKPLTGLDKPVIDFLESRGEIQRFLGECYALIDSAVDNYLSRGFESLTVSFGCTGGRHRSVYSAQHMAEHLKAKYPEIEVILNHRERGLTSRL